MLFHSTLFFFFLVLILIVLIVSLYLYHCSATERLPSIFCFSLRICPPQYQISFKGFNSSCTRSNYQTKDTRPAYSLLDSNRMHSSFLSRSYISPLLGSRFPVSSIALRVSITWSWIVCPSGVSSIDGKVGNHPFGNILLLAVVPDHLWVVLRQDFFGQSQHKAPG